MPDPVEGFQTDSPTAPPIPERSPLEPLGQYAKRVAKWRKDNAWRAGQIRAIENLGQKQRETVPDVLP